MLQFQPKMLLLFLQVFHLATLVKCAALHSAACLPGASFSEPMASTGGHNGSSSALCHSFTRKFILQLKQSASDQKWQVFNPTSGRVSVSSRQESRKERGPTALWLRLQHLLACAVALRVRWLLNKHPLHLLSAVVWVFFIFYFFK